MNRSATLRSLAAELKIHVSTVSRVLNGSEAEAKSAASPDKIDAIRNLARLRNYEPNAQAVGLKTRKSRTIFTFIPRISDIVTALVYEGVEETARRLGYLALISNTHDDLDRQASHLTSAIARRVDGLIFCDAQAGRFEILQEVRRIGIPHVLVHRRLGPDYCSVTCDDFKGGQLAAKHLIEQGHEEFAVLAGLEYASTGADRCAGFVAYCASHGISIPKERIFHSGFDTRSGRIVGEQICALAQVPTAVFATNDFLAIGLMGALRDAGLKAGEDVAVVGYNDTPLAAELPIALSSVGSPLHLIGARGMELLYDAIQGRKIHSETLAPELKVRTSSLRQ